MGWSRCTATVPVNSWAFTDEPAMKACMLPQWAHLSWPDSGLNSIPAPHEGQANCSLTADSGMKADLRCHISRCQYKKSQMLAKQMKAIKVVTSSSLPVHSVSEMPRKTNDFVHGARACVLQAYE